MRFFSVQSSCIFFICFVLITFYSRAQTTIISATGDGGFETGNTFALNNWTVTSGTATQNQWVCNTGASAGFSGTRCAYVTNNTGAVPPPHTYTISTAYTSHFYRTISIPAGETQITLNFLWIGNGETTYDRLRIWLVPVTYTPVFGTAITATGTAPTGRIQAGLANYSAQGTWVNATSVNIPAAYAGTTVRLVFEWSNDNTLGTQPPAGIDNISLVSQAPSPPPANNDCAGAVSLTVNPNLTCTSSTSGTSVSATQSFAGCAGTADDDVWYSFIATGVSHIVTVTPGTMSDAVLQVYSGSCASLTSLSCTDLTVGSNAETVTLTGLTSGLTYFIRVFSYANGTGQGTFSMCVTTPPAPANDNCGAAVALTVNPGTTCTATTSGTSQYATQSQAGCSGTADDDVWYSFVASTNTHAVTVTPGTMSNVVFEMFSGACGALASLGCINATTGAAAETNTFTGLTIGATYRIRVYSNANGTGQGTFTVCVTTVPPPPPNDNCSGAIALTVNPAMTCTTSTSGTTVSATQSAAGCVGTADDDVWYSFVATTSQHYAVATPGTISDIVMQFYSGGCAGLTSIGCVDNTLGANAETALLTGLTPGTTYYIRIYSYGNGVNQGTFTLCINTVVPPTNDNCSGAIALTPSSTCNPTSGTTLGATQSIPAITCAGFTGNADDDVWYSFVAAFTSQTISVTSSALDMIIDIRSGACNGSNFACADAVAGTGTETVTVSGLTVGATYYVRIYSYGTTAGSFNICVTNPIISSNDCAGAVSLTVNPDVNCITSTAGTTVGATQSLAGCTGTADDDVWFSFVPTGTSHTVTVTPNTLYDAVFQVFSGTCGTLTSVACRDATTGTNAESLTLTGLTIGATYFVRVYSWWNYTADRGTFSICITTPCTPSTATGTTALACPSVVSGGLGLNGADPPAMDCFAAACVDLEATYLELGQTTAYTVESIPYIPPYQFGCLANQVSVNVDDVWSPVVNLPFNFCFYGNSYNQCLISSNGVITFDLVNNSPGGTSAWQFNTNLPSTQLFRNSIFGVYHDIDPSVAGHVGWQLITLNTGCRALVASWQGIPMYDDAFTTFNCNSQYYTGMIVLYENTNVIEVYVQEKNVCSDWNDGNAVIGIQNANATVASVAPNRNSLDPDWTVSPNVGEAWRFVPSGPTITTLRWYEGAGTTGPLLATCNDGSCNTINVCPPATTVYTAEVTYQLCNGTTLKETESATVTINSSKIWNGSASNNWNTAANWTPVGVPTNLDCVVIPNVTAPNVAPIISGTAYDAYGYSLRVLNGGNLTMNSANNLTITDFVNVNAGGNFLIKDDASLIQINNTSNTGIVNMERTTTPIYRFDYTYWNSPMTLASNYTLGMLSQNLTQPDKYYHWIPSSAANGGIGDWAQESAATIMDPRKGYIIRGPNTYSFTPTAFATYTGIFTGTPNNGPVNSPITFGSFALADTRDKWNLIGNPYPSAVSASAFLNYPNNQNVIDGTIYFWTHNSAISASFPDPFYGDFVLNYTASDYAAWNSTGGTAATSGGPTPSGFIAAGQSFFVQSKAVAGNAVFLNSMRVSNNNSQFFRSAGPTAAVQDIEEENIEKHRIWLNMTNTTSAFNQLLVGYVEGATLDFDRGFDGVHMNEADISFYSVIPERILAIQGRPLPFDAEDRVPLGYRSANADNYSIRIDHFDGLFDNQDIFIEDLQLGIIHNLKEAPYNFSTQAGTFDDRFLLRYTDNSLGTDQRDPISGTTAFISNQQLHVRADKNIESIRIYDVAGKLIREYKPNGNHHEYTGDFQYAQGVYLATIKLADGSSGSRKLMN